MSLTIAQALTIAFQFVNQPMADMAIAEMASDLSQYPEGRVLAALKRCRSELKSIRYGDILDRLPGGHPGPEEAWSIVSRGMQNEALTVVWTDQIREAYGVAVGLVDDLVAARLAFKEAYLRLVSEARARHQQPVWSVSAGTDPHDRERAVSEAVKTSKLLPHYAGKFLPYPVAHLTALPEVKQLT